MANELPKELTSGEKVFINSFLHEPPQWIRWVKKTNKKNAIQPRLMVVTKYRVYSIKRNKMGKKQIVREGHLYDLKEVSTDDVDRCVLAFTGFKIVAFATNLGVDLPKVVLQCFYNISYTFSDAAFPRITMSPEGRNPPSLDRTPPGPVGGFEEVYLAHCDFLGIKPSPDIIILVDDLFASGNPSLDLDLCTGVEKDHVYALNLAPIFATLRHNTYFTSFSLHDKSRGSEAVRGIADVLTHNITLTSVDISGVDCSSEEAWEALGTAIQSNPNNSLLHINVSDNPIGEKAIITLAAGIGSIPHPIESVHVSNTGLQAKGITQVFRALTSNLTLSSTIHEVSAAGNPIPNGPLSVSVADWLVAMDTYQPAPEKKCLRKMNLSNLAIDIPPVLDIMRNAYYTCVEHLDLSNNKLEEYSIQLLTALISKSSALSHLNLSNCSLTGPLITSVINSTSLNTALPNLVLDVTGNDLSKEDQAVIGLSAAIAKCAHIHTLKIGELNLKRETLIPLCKAIGENNTLQGLDFSGNFRQGALAGKGENPLDLIVNSVKNHPTLTYFACAGRKDNYLGKDIIPLFKLLVDNNRLLELDVSHNSFGDDGARELFDTLRTNYCLKSLSFDHNNITYPGWQALRRCILVNRSLVDIKYPKKDVTKTITDLPRNKSDMHEKLRELFIEVSIFTNNNLTGQADARPLQPSPKPPIPTPPFELVLTASGYSTPTTYVNNTGYSQMPIQQTASLYNIPPVYSPNPTPQTGSYNSVPPPPAPGTYSPPAPQHPNTYSNTAYSPIPPVRSYSNGTISSYSSEDSNGYGNYSPQSTYGAYEPPPHFPARPSPPTASHRPASVMSPSRAPPPPPAGHATVAYGASPLPPNLRTPPLVPPSSATMPANGAPPPIPRKPSSTTLTSNSPKGLPNRPTSAYANPPQPPPLPGMRSPPPPPEEPYPEDLQQPYAEDGGEYYYDENQGTGEEYEDLTANQANRNATYYY